MPFKIFVSYARDDDVPLPGATPGKGFVGTLDDHLHFHFRSLGPPMPKLWRDVRGIEPSDQFDPIIANEIAASDALLVLLSNNWVHRPYCKLELDLFRQRWQHEGEAALRGRIVVVVKRYVANEDRPPLLQGQEGYLFYRVDERYADDAAGREHEFFGPGELHEEYHTQVKRLARVLWRKARAHDQLPPPHESDPPVKEHRRRVIYIAQPAPDMRDAYLRVRGELEGRGYAVVPDAETKIPSESGEVAQQFVDDALAGAEASIHLIGNMLGYRPATGDRIVKLQLRRAAERQTLDTPGATAFRRIIWAPRVIVDDGSDADEPTERDPLAVMTRLDGVREDDKVDGRELSQFVDFVTQHLKRQEPVVTLPLHAIEADSRVFVYHAEEDTDYGIEIAQALEERRVEPVLPIFEGDPVEVEAWRREQLRECDAVVICWARTTEVWARSHTPEFRDWSKLGRDREFRCRALIAGPPPGQRKGVLLKLPPRREIDVVIDLTGCERLTPEALDALVEPTLAGHSG